MCVCVCVCVLTWLEANCKAVIVRADENDPIISERKEKYARSTLNSLATPASIHLSCISFLLFRASRRYTGVPRNIYRHILISDLDRVVAALPPVNESL